MTEMNVGYVEYRLKELMKGLPGFSVSVLRQSGISGLWHFDVTFTNFTNTSPGFRLNDLTRHNITEQVTHTVQMVVKAVINHQVLNIHEGN